MQSLAQGPRVSRLGKRRSPAQYDRRVRDPECCDSQADCSRCPPLHDRRSGRVSWGKIDVWVNRSNDGGRIQARDGDYLPRPGAWNVRGGLKQMRRQCPGRLRPGLPSIPLHYCSAKAASWVLHGLAPERHYESSPVRLTTVHLPNSPQFDWARSRLPRCLQPVPPIHAPEVAGEAIEASHQAPPELWVGIPTFQAILRTMVAPGLLDGFAPSRGRER
jgi:hypothetical protein